MLANITILILAAGASSRMRGRDKLLETIAGQPQLTRISVRALATGWPVLVALPPPPHPRRSALAALSVSMIDVPDAALGLSRSIARGVTAATAHTNDADHGLMILPADMPGFTTGALVDLGERFRQQPQFIWRGATADLQPGHPTIFPRDLWAELASVTGDAGGRAVLARHAARIRIHPLPGDMATLDLDTPEDWEAYRARSAGSA